jgi:hypothetical protein
VSKRVRFQCHPARFAHLQFFYTFSPLHGQLRIIRGDTPGVKTILFSFALATGLEVVLASDLSSCNESTAESTKVLVQNAVCRDSAIASTAVAKLRAIGPEGLAALLKAHGAEVALHLASLQHDQEIGCDQDWQAAKMAIRWR